MAKTMNKSDVLYRAKATAFDFNQFKQHAKKQPSVTVKSAISDAIAAKKNKTMKDPEAKIGLIDGHLFLRIKDGSKHIDDFLIVKNFKSGKDDGPVRDANYTKMVKAFIDQRKALLKTVSDGEAAIKATLDELKSSLAFAQAKAQEAERGVVGYDNIADKVDKIVSQAEAKLAAAKRIFTKDIHPIFDKHRTIRKPEGVDDKDVDGYGGPFYLSTVKPVYKKAVEWLKLGDTTVEQIKAAAKNARRFVDNADDKLSNYRSLAADLKQFAQQEVVDGKASFAKTTPIEDVKESLENDLGRIKSIKATPPPGDDDGSKLAGLVRRYLENATGRVVGARNGFTRLEQHGDKMDKIVARLKEIPKAYLKDNTIKAEVKNVAGAKKDLDNFIKSSKKHLVAAAKVYSSIKSEAAKT